MLKFIFSAKRKHKKNDSWYFIKKIFLNYEYFGDSDVTNVSQILNPAFWLIGGLAIPITNWSFVEQL